jgi:hypothetical protein
MSPNDAHPDLHPDDIELLERLGRIAAVVDPVPDDVVELGRAAFELHRADSILMTLASDALAEGSLRAVPGESSGSRLHVFEHDTTSIEVEVTTRGDLARIIGIVDDTGSLDLDGARITLETVSTSTGVDLDGGRFTLEGVPLGLVRLSLERAGERLRRTPWFDVG